MSVVVTSFYEFVEIPEYQVLREELLENCKKLSVGGTILLAKEGINGSISGTREQINDFYQMLRSYSMFSNMEYKENICNKVPFEKMKVRLKKEIVALGEDNIDMKNRGEYIAPNDWDDFIARDDVVVIDTRNDYECNIGSFENAINPKTRNFRDFPKWFENHEEEFKDKKIAMFCTGGIRCEKSTAYVKGRGFDDVYHLQGGIINYFKVSENKNKKWNGQCFVFDDRCAIDDDMNPSDLRCNSCNVELRRNEVELRKNQKFFYCSNCFEEVCCS